MARSSIETLEGLWSRFLADSDISRINANSGLPVRVDPLTIDLVALAVDACDQTSGVFSPTTGRSIRGAGYDRPFDQMARLVSGCDWPASPARDVEIHRTASTITVPAAVSLDLGGIGKGAAADHTVAALLDAGAEGAMTNLGGDLRAAGIPPAGGWQIRLDCPGSNDESALRIASGAVCTSSTVKRRWQTPDGERHHIMEPTSGASVESDICSATVVGATAAQCEVLATASVALGRTAAARLLEANQTSGVFVDYAGELHDVGMIRAYR
jgi:thiamine biosynthesis lipoprotein